MCVDGEFEELTNSLHAMALLQEEPGNLDLSSALKTFESALAHPERFGAK